MLVASMPFLRRWGIAVSGLALIAVLATVVAMRPDAENRPSFIASLDLDRPEYNIGDAPNVTVSVMPILGLSNVSVAESNLFYSEVPSAVATAVLPAVLMNGLIIDGEGVATLTLDEITCFSPQVFLAGTITDQATGQVLEVTNEVYLRIDYDQGTDPSGVPDCVFQDIDVDGDGVPEFPGNPPGGEGCPSTFWKHCVSSQAPPSNDDDDDDPCVYPLPLLPSTQFSAIFEDAFPGRDLRQVVNFTTVGSLQLRDLGRATVAALLNAQSPLVDYDLSVDEVIQLFDDTFPGTDEEYHSLMRFFEVFNNQGSGLCTDFMISLQPVGGGSTGGARR